MNNKNYKIIASFNFIVNKLLFKIILLVYTYYIYKRPTKGPRSNFTSLTTHTIVISK